MLCSGQSTTLILFPKTISATMAAHIFGNKLVLLMNEISDIFYSAIPQNEIIGKYATQQQFFKIYLEHKDDILLDLRLAVNHPDLFALVHESSEFPMPTLWSTPRFQNIKDDAYVMEFLGKRDWYNKLFIDLSDFRSPEVDIFSTLTHFSSLAHLEITLDCKTILEAPCVKLPQLKKLNIFNETKCEHKNNCAITKLLRASRNLEILKLCNASIIQGNQVMHISKLKHLSLNCVRFKLNREKRQKFIGRQRNMRYLHLNNMDIFDGARLSRCILGNLDRMKRIKSLSISLNGSKIYNFKKLADCQLRYLDISSALFGKPNHNLYAFFDHLRNHFPQKCLINFCRNWSGGMRAVDRYFHIANGEGKFLSDRDEKLKSNLEYLKRKHEKNFIFRV